MRTPSRSLRRKTGKEDMEGEREEELEETDDEEEGDRGGGSSLSLRCLAR